MTVMDFELTDRCKELRERLLAFMDEHVYPAEPVYHEQLLASGEPHFHPPVMEELKERARELGLWNLFLPHDNRDLPAPGLSNGEYAPLAEIMGRSEGAVKLLTFRAMTSLRKQLGAPLPAERSMEGRQ